MSVRVLAEKWAGQLPSGPAMIGEEEVNASSWPDLMKRWIPIGVTSWIRSSLRVPDIPLARMEEADVRESWQSFEEAVCHRWGLPVEEIRPLLEELLEDLLMLLAQPVKRIPFLLFESRDTLELEVLTARLERLVIHRDLGRALVRYAERKGLREIDRDLAGRVIAQVDQKLVERYNSDAWAEQLQPLFDLWGGPPPARRVRAVLEGRGAKGAGEIPNELSPVSMEWVLDRLRQLSESSPSESREPTERVSPSAERMDSPSEESPKESASSGSIFEPSSSKPRSLSELFGSKGDVSKESDEQREEKPASGALHQKFQFDEPDLGRYLEEVEPPETHDPVEGRNRDESHSTTSPEDSPKESIEEVQAPSSDQAHSAASLPEESDEESGVHRLYAEPEEEPEEEDTGDENAIWKKFLAPGEESSDSSDPADTDAVSVEGNRPVSQNREEDAEPQHEEEPAVRWLDPSATEAEGPDVDPTEALETWLGSDLDRFRDEIFDGSDGGLREALRDLSRMERWGDAARYLQEDVFDRYRIDLFDDAAVDLTDRMQAWFEGER